ncbi:DUF6415 family natural product biosynthesis protein [Streptomyces sp. NBC_01471]|uniref:DUF6415 family natural product biosynthesis protein n=1 Tax=Streptomyces sp. NBC_01471 TaxID=2903879 RepID=UPI0032495432
MNTTTVEVVDRAEVLPLVDTVLGWDLDGPSLPEPEIALGMVEHLTDFGRIAADALCTLCLSIPANSAAGQRAQATLSEASRRLYMPPPHVTRRAAAHRAQNLARLYRALVRATAQVEEQARTAFHASQDATTEGNPG